MCYSRGWGNVMPRCDSYWSSAGVVCNPTTTTSSTTTMSTSKTSPTTSSTTTSTTTTTTTTSTPRPTTTTKTTTTTTIPTTTTTKPTTTTTKQTTVTTQPRTTTTTQKTTTTTQPTTTTPTTTTTTKKPPPPTTTTTKTTAAPSEPIQYNMWIYNRELWRYFLYLPDGRVITSRPDPRYYDQLRNTTTKSPSTTTTATTTTTRTTTTPTPKTTTTAATPRPRQINSNSIYNTVGGENSNRINNQIDPYGPQNIRHHSDNSRPRHEHRHHHNSIKEGYVHDQPIMDDSDGDVKETEDEYDSFDGVVEQPKPTTTKRPIAPSYTEYRLLGGREYTGYREGRVEVRLANSFTWGVICGDNWNLKAAMVTCKHFNAGYARLAQQVDYFGGGDMDKVLATVRCTGKEDRLEDCTVEKTEDTPGKLSCSRAQSVAGVICETRLPDLEPDLKAIEQSVFLRDKYLYYLQCAYEEKCLSSSANALYGSRTWAYATRRLLHFSTIAKNIGTADFRPDIDRSQWEWHACHQHYHSMESFSHYDIIDKHGNQVAEGHKASFCLEDSKCNRGVFPKYNCQQFGHQGISVGCEDSYLADIDCQWIDVTDVPPGLYTLKIELNPNMRVAEITYDNNVAKCTLYFNTQQAQVYNCKLDSLL